MLGRGRFIPGSAIPFHPEHDISTSIRYKVAFPCHFASLIAYIGTGNLPILEPSRHAIFRPLLLRFRGRSGFHAVTRCTRPICLSRVLIAFTPWRPRPKASKRTFSCASNKLPTTHRVLFVYRRIYIRYARRLVGLTTNTFRSNLLVCQYTPCSAMLWW